MVHGGVYIFSYEKSEPLLNETKDLAKGFLVDKVARVDNEQNVLSKLDFADTHSRVKSLGSDVTNCGARITRKLEGMFNDRELSSVNVEKPSSEVNNQHDIYKDGDDA